MWSSLVDAALEAGSSPGKVLSPFSITISIHLASTTLHEILSSYLNYSSPLATSPLVHTRWIYRSSSIMSDPERSQALEDYKKSLLELREWEAKLKTLRLGIKDLQREFDVSEDNIKALQSVGQIIGEVLKQLDEERCKYPKLKLFAPMVVLRN